MDVGGALSVAATGRTVDAITTFAGGVGCGATLVVAVIAFRARDGSR